MSPVKKNNPSKTGFSTEASLVERFVGALQSGSSVFGPLQVTTEWSHRAGFVDVLARDATASLIAFEAKLSDWKRAYLQAYRNTAYANRVYVLLPSETVHRALRDQEEFEFRGIGLCSFDGQQIRVFIEATEQEPLLIWLRKRAHEHFNGLPDGRDARSRRGRPRSVSEARF